MTSYRTKAEKWLEDFKLHEFTAGEKIVIISFSRHLDSEDKIQEDICGKCGHLCTFCYPTPSPIKPVELIESDTFTIATIGEDIVFPMFNKINELAEKLNKLIEQK